MVDSAVGRRRSFGRYCCSPGFDQEEVYNLLTFKPRVRELDGFASLPDLIRFCGLDARSLERVRDCSCCRGGAMLHE